MKAILKKSGLETRDKRKGVKGHVLLYPEWHLALAGQYLDAYENLRTPRQPMRATPAEGSSSNEVIETAGRARHNKSILADHLIGKAVVCSIFRARL